MQSSRTEQEAFGHYLIDKAKKIGVYIEPAKLSYYGERKRKPSGECIVYIDENRNRVIKVKDPYAKAPMKGHDATNAIYEHIVHNLLFPNTKYSFLGISESSLGDIRFVLEQNYLKDGFETPSQHKIDNFLSEILHLKKEGIYWYGDEYLAITDVDAASDNVLLDYHGNLFFIDPIIKFKKSVKEIIDRLSTTHTFNLAHEYPIEHNLMTL